MKSFSKQTGMREQFHEESTVPHSTALQIGKVALRFQMAMTSDE